MVAALFCAADGRLIADDALRVEHVGGVARCYRGSGQIRLRQRAAELAGSFPRDIVVETGRQDRDQRQPVGRIEPPARRAPDSESFPRHRPIVRGRDRSGLQRDDSVGPSVRG